MYKFLAFGLGLLLLTAAIFLLILGNAMRKDRLQPNIWAGIRTKHATDSTSEWRKLQRRGSTPIIGLSIAYMNTAFLFILQGIYYDTISEFIPITVLTIQSIVGIIWTYREIKR